MRNKIIAIIILSCIAAIVIFLNVNFKAKQFFRHALELQPVDRPLPELTSAEKRLNSYTPERGDLKYRLVQRPTITDDPATGWSLYTSKEYGFSFIFPKESKISNTETLGYQLPPNQSYKGSRDNFEIKITDNNSAYFLLFQNYPNFHVDNATVTASSQLVVNGLKMSKSIMESTDPKFESSQIIMFSFEKAGRNYIWYGTFDSKDVESINNFQSVVSSTKFNP